LQEAIIETPFGQLCLLILAGVCIHVVYLVLNLIASKILRLSLRDHKTILFMASQKTLPTALAVIEFLPEAKFGVHGLLTIPCIIGHLSQLFIDAFIASRMAAAEEERQEKRKEAANAQVRADVLTTSQLSADERFTGNQGFFSVRY
jgi:solute carrier family 10 (sodium/bile acid cotransporter), member 7